MNDHLMTTYTRQQVTFERGEGAWLWDTQGERYLDALSGIAVCGLGHAHPAVTKAICEQATKLTHTSNLYRISAQTELSQRLCRVADMDAAFFCNSGAEANEAAIKLARLYGHHRGIENPTIVVMKKSFHGRTLATLTATGNRKVQAGFEPLVPGFTRAPFGDIAALENIAHNRSDIVAVLMEPIQGEGGIHIPERGYLAAVRKLCREHSWLMMLDEVQSGIGRTGRWFAYQHENAIPDVVATAKALGNGFPIGACLARGQAARVFAPGSHGSTFGGNPLACQAALAVIDTIENEQLCQQATTLGDYLANEFKARLVGQPGVVEVRGRGLMIGIELEHACAALVSKALKEKLLINVTAENVIRLLPPLIISYAQADEIIDTVSGLVTSFVEAHTAS